MYKLTDTFMLMVTVFF